MDLLGSKCTAWLDDRYSRKRPYRARYGHPSDRPQSAISRHNPALQPPNYCQIATHRDSVPVEANTNRLEIHRLGGLYFLNAAAPLVHSYE